MLWLTKNIHIYQNKGHKQIIIIFVFFEKKYRDKNKVIETKKYFKELNNEINKTTKKMAQMSRLKLSREINHEALI